MGHPTVGQGPAAARLGQELVAISLSGRVPTTARTASAGSAAGVGRAGLPQRWSGCVGTARLLTAVSASNHFAQTLPARKRLTLQPL